VLVNELRGSAAGRRCHGGDLIDAAVIFGTGFAPFRGGPLAYAKSRGMGEVVARLAELETRYVLVSSRPGWSLLQGTTTAEIPTELQRSSGKA